MVLDLLLELLALSVELVDQAIDGGVHVFLLVLGEQVGAADMQRGLGLVTEFFDGEDDMDIDGLVEVPVEALDLLVDVAAQ